MSLSRIKIILVVLATFAFAGKQSSAQNVEPNKHIEVALRMVGHQVLLSAGDSTSRVMPVEIGKNVYRIQFTNEFALQPEELVAIVDRVMLLANVSSSYIVEVEECETQNRLYAFEVAESKNEDLIPCKARELPKGCYAILFTITGSTLATEEAVAAPAPKSWKNIFYIAAIAALLLLVGVFYFKNRKQKSQITLSRPYPNPNWISLGKYHFDKLNAQLIIEEQRIELTSKEADLLFLLYEMVNTTVEKEVLLNKVWGDEGDYIGRTLDVFISKLRKKLEFDAQLKIVNVRGVGYKLVVDV